MKRTLIGLNTLWAVAILPALLIPGRAALAAGSAEMNYKALCATCHGDRGEGDGAVAASLDPKPANFTDPKFLPRLSDAYLKAVTKAGKMAAVTTPSDQYRSLLNPSFAKVLTDAQITKLLAYLRAIQKEKPVANDHEMMEFNAGFTEAANLFADNCARCHGPYGDGAGPDIMKLDPQTRSPVNPVPPDFRQDLFLSRYSDASLRSILKYGRLEAMKRGALAQMPPMGAGFSDAQLTEMVAYLRSMAPGAPAPTAPVTPPEAAAAGGIEPARANAVSIVRNPDDLPAPVGKRGPTNVRVDLEAVEVDGWLGDGTSFTYWTFNGKVPGPFIRVRVGDTVEVHLKNRLNQMIHSIDLHAVLGPGGGAVYTQVPAGQEKAFSFKAVNPGLYVYHCATPMVAHHISMGMYGLILVEPEGGLPPVDREFYMMQGEIYTTEPYGTKGHLHFDLDSLMNESAQYAVFNGAAGALTATAPLKAKVGETIRIFFGVGGPNYMSSFHLIGGIWDRVYEEASLVSPALLAVQTTLVPPGGATMVESKMLVPGKFILVDHALSRLEHGLAGFIIVEGPEDKSIINPLTPVTPPPPGDMH